jgi:hypothetical protein
MRGNAERKSLTYMKKCAGYFAEGTKPVKSNLPFSTARRCGTPALELTRD